MESFVVLPQKSQKILEGARPRCRHGQRDTRHRMSDRNRSRMQKRVFYPFYRFRHGSRELTHAAWVGARAVKRVTDDRVSVLGQMNTQLMGASGVRKKCDVGKVRIALARGPTSERLASR